MSANNKLVIIEKGKNNWCIHENLCVDNDFSTNKNNFLHRERGLRTAITWANNYCQENMVEYGVRILFEEFKSIEKEDKGHGNKAKRIKKETK